MADLETERTDGVLWVKLNRPERKNAMTVPMWESLARDLVGAEIDPDVRVVVLRGAGGNFCAGADLTGAADGGSASASDASEGARSANAGSLEDKTLAMLRRRIAPAAVALGRLSKPSIAMVEGVAAGAGCNLALGCDLVYAADDARFSQIFVKRALSLDFGGAWLLPRLVGLQKAKELALFGDLIGAEEARSLGMIAGVEKSADLENAVRERAERLAEQSPLAMASIKRVLDESLQLTFAEAIDREFVVQAKCTASPDFAEGVSAFLEKRKPDFGRSR